MSEVQAEERVEERSRHELEEERDFLLASLEDLEREREAGDIADPDYSALKDDYTARAAAVLRAIERAAARPPRRPAVADAGKRHRRRWRGPVVALAVVAFAALAAALANGSSGERVGDDPATGSIAATGPSRDLARARQLVGEGMTLEAIKLYDAVLAVEPDQPEALAYRGWLVRLAGRAAGDEALVAKGLEFLDRAVAADPTYPDARFFRGMVLYQDRRDPAGAVAEFRAFLANDPPQAMVPLVEDVLRRALADAAPPAPPR